MHSRESSPGLRKRQSSPTAVKTKRHDHATLAPTNRTTPHRTRYLAIALIGAAILFVASQRIKPTRSINGTYAICTSGAGNIYTVDTTAPVAQCFVVQNGLFVDLGAEGLSSPSCSHVQVLGY